MRARVPAIATLALSALLLAGCDSGAIGSADTSAPSSADPTTTPSETPAPAPEDDPTPAPPPEPTSTPEPNPAPIALPTDCRAILSDDVIAQFDNTPLNDPMYGAGVQPDGSLHCVWRHPSADTTGLVTVISYLDRGPALELLNERLAEGYTCYESQGGTRCEITTQNPMYPVTDGKTLFWRDGVLIDTSYSNLAPDGYTASIVDHLFPTS